MADWLIFPLLETDSAYTKAYLGYETHVNGVIVELDDHDPATSNGYVATKKSYIDALNFIASIAGTKRDLLRLAPVKNVRDTRKQGYMVTIERPAQRSLEPEWVKDAPYEPVWAKTFNIL